MIVSDILDRKDSAIHMINDTDPLRSAMMIMEREEIGSVVVVADNQSDYIISERDIILAINMLGAHALDRAISEVTLRDSLIVNEHDSISAVERRMTYGRYRHALVIAGNKIAGVVSIGDIIKSGLSDAKLESQVLRDMARSRLIPA